MFEPHEERLIKLTRFRLQIGTEEFHDTTVIEFEDCKAEWVLVGEREKEECRRRRAFLKKYFTSLEEDYISGRINLRKYINTICLAATDEDIALLGRSLLSAITKGPDIGGRPWNTSYVKAYAKLLKWLDKQYDPDQKGTNQHNKIKKRIESLTNIIIAGTTLEKFFKSKQKKSYT